MWPELERTTNVKQRQVERLGLVDHARQVKDSLGKSLFGGVDRRSRRFAGTGGKSGFRQLAAGILFDEPVIERLGFIFAAVSPIEVRHRVGQPPVELPGRLER